MQYTTGNINLKLFQILQIYCENKLRQIYTMFR